MAGFNRQTVNWVNESEEINEKTDIISDIIKKLQVYKDEIKEGQKDKIDEAINVLKSL